MMRVGKMAICLAGGLALGAGLRADDAALPGNPYASIVTRNVFGLNPPPPPGPAVEASPPPKITPNGIMSIFGQWQVLFKVAEPGRPGKPAGDQSYMLAEGERQDDIEVVKIDQKTDVITFNNHGDIQEIPLADANSTTANAEPGSYGFPIPPPDNGYRAGNRFGGYGNRGQNFGGNNSAGNNNADNGAVSGTSQTGGNISNQQQPAMSIGRTTVMIAAQHLKAVEDGDPTAAIFPPTDLDKEAGVPSNLAPGSPNPNPTP